MKRPAPSNQRTGHPRCVQLIAKTWNWSPEMCRTQHGMFAVPLLGFILSPARRWTWQKWVPLGAVADFPENQTRLATYRNPFSRPWDGDTANIPCWVRRIAGDQFQVFAINCTHLGCPVRWFEGAGLFMCPCHGGVFYSNGDHASGPPPRPLYQYEYKVQDGQLLVLGGQLPTLSERV